MSENKKESFTLIGKDVLHNYPDHRQVTIKIKNFLDQLGEENPQTPLKKLFHAIEEPTKKDFVMKLVVSAPAKLAIYYFSDQIACQEKAELAAAIRNLLAFQLPDTAVLHLRTKLDILNNLQANMRDSMAKEVSQFIANMNAFINDHWQGLRPTPPASSEASVEEKSSAASLADVAAGKEADVAIVTPFIQKAQAYYQALLDFSDNFSHDTKVSLLLAKKLLTFPVLIEHILYQSGYEITEAGDDLFLQYIMQYRYARESAFYKSEYECLLELTEQYKSQYDNARSETLKHQKTSEAFKSKYQNIYKLCKIRIDTLLQTQDRLGFTIEDADAKRLEAEACIAKERVGSRNEVRHPPACLEGIGFQILGGVMAVLGIVAVTLALAALVMGSGGLLLPTAGIIGGGLLSAVGWYSLRHGIKTNVQEDLAKFVPTS